jgi:hypothetical protein
MTLQFHYDGSAWKAHLQLKFHNPDFRDDSLDVTDLEIRGHRLSFHDPKSWNRSIGNAQTGFDVYFEGVSTTSSELQGTAETARSDSGGMHCLGTWHLQRQVTAQP